jgi:hypothetical protein
MDSQELGMNIKLNYSLYNSEYIDKIEDSKIKIKLSLNNLDLNEYYKSNGYVRTSSLIKEFTNLGKYRINCDNYIKNDGNKISKSELIVMLYNSCTAYGMGIFQADDKTLRLEDAEEILKSNYIDYYKGTAIKIGFEKFPIINFEKFEKYNGVGKFMDCIRKLQSNTNINKVKLTNEQILNEIDRLNSNN